MLKKLLIVAVVMVALAGCTAEKEQANVEAPVATTVESSSPTKCAHHGGACSEACKSGEVPCKAHEGEACHHGAEECTCVCASCGHEWTCEGHEGETCHHGAEGCTCKCPSCGAECECKCPEGHDCTCEGHEGEACPGGEACTCDHSHGKHTTDSAAGHPACSRMGSCRSHSGT